MTQALAQAALVEAREFGWPDFLAGRPAGPEGDERSAYAQCARSGQAMES